MSAATAAFSVIKPLGTMAGEKMNRPVRIGFIGTGNRGTYGVITSMCRNNKVELYALADLFRDRIDKVLPHLNNLNKENGLPNIEERNIYVGKDAYRQLLQDDKVDAVVIATPAYAHPFIFEEAVKARKHVYCEKPAAPDAYGALRMIKAAQGVRDLSLVMGFQVRHSSAFDEMIRRVHNGDIGRIVAAQLYYNAGGAGGAKPAVEDDEFRFRHHFQYLELSGGTLNDQAVHMMDICREVLQANPLYAMGHSSRKGVKCEYGNFNTNYQILYKYPEDINVMVQQTSVGSATGGVVARFFGENGTAEAKYSGGVFITGPNKWDSGIDNALGDADPNKGKSFIGSIISGNYINEIEAGCNST
ncbi:MAG: Gfo/Idh/MocA family oxidoreductase, partial [bacterium]|nr:Gfo/Idh/MocA family oxidoreductase [bacterium]